jgi:ABC-type dipeptide/oligopeptide/nickel transport system permease component
LFRARAPVTLWLVACALAAAYALGILWGLLAPVRGVLGLASSALAVAAVAVPVAAAAAWLAPASAPRPFAAALLMVVSSSALVSRHQRAAVRNELAQDYVRTAVAFGAEPWRVRLRSFRGASAAVVSLLAVDLSAAFTSAFVVEHAFALPGIGQATLRAVAARDVSWLMAVTLALALAVALAQIASDTLLGVLDPRVRRAFLQQRGAHE